MITSNFNYKDLIRPDLTIDLNLLMGNPLASIKYVSNQNQFNIISVTVNISVIFHPLLLLQLM